MVENLTEAAALDAKLAAWHDLQGRSSDDPQPYVDAAKALLGHARFEEADKLMREAKARFPGNRDVIMEYALAAYSARNWAEAVRRLTDATLLFPHFARPYPFIVNALIAMLRFEQAQSVIDRAAGLFPDHPAILSARSQVALARNDAASALAFSEQFRARFPNSVGGYIGSAKALRAARRQDEAEALLESVREKFHDYPPFLYQRALTATSRRDWQVAFDRWADLRRRFPATEHAGNGIGDMVTLWRMACIEQDTGALDVVVPEELRPFTSVVPPPPPRESLGGQTGHLTDQALMMLFDALGDRCEFGLVQRHFGAEPLSLLRWSEIEPDALVALLASRFDGVGTEEHTYVSIVRDEYFAGDRRYFRMHTFTKVHEMTEERMLKTAATRMRFLRDKLLEDLDAGDKIFVYKRHGATLSGDEERAIADAMRKHYPKTSLLLVGKADDPKNAGLVEIRGPNFYAGFLDKIDLGPRHISYVVWNTICRRVHADWLARRAQQP